MKIYIQLFAIFNFLFGLMGVLTPELWYELTPGASDTGPFNIHFVRDIGIAFAAAGIGLWLGVSNSRLNKLSGPAVALTFIGGHAMLHTYEMMTHHADGAAIFRDVILIVIPAALAGFWFYTKVKKQAD